MKLRQFFPYYGAKWKIGCWYPPPTYRCIIEPFAGSAGYATRYADRTVILVDADEQIAGTWQYLIDASAEEIRALPSRVDDVADVKASQEARWLIGWWLARARMRPALTASAWMRTGVYQNRFWGEQVRDRIAAQVEHIKHWVVLHDDYKNIEDSPGPETWFIDPPYEKAGGHYRNHAIDREHLRSWVLSRQGQAIVCGGGGETWLPFKPMREHQGINNRRMECIYTKDST